MSCALKFHRALLVITLSLCSSLHNYREHCNSGYRDLCYGKDILSLFRGQSNERLLRNPLQQIRSDFLRGGRDDGDEMDEGSESRQAKKNFGKSGRKTETGIGNGNEQDQGESTSEKSESIGGSLTDESEGDESGGNRENTSIKVEDDDSASPEDRDEGDQPFVNNARVLLPWPSVPLP